MLSEDWTFLFQESLWNSFCYCVCCFIAHYVNSSLSPRFLSGYKKLPRQSQHGWNNRGVSTTHACIMFAFAVNYWLKVNPTMTIPAHVGQYEAYMMDIMMGYLYYDTAIEYAVSGSVDTLAHHAMGLSSHLMSRLSNVGPLGFYTMLVYLAEGSTPFLHICWLLHAMKMTASFAFQALSIILLVLFFVLRIVNGPFMVYHMLEYRHVDQWQGSTWLFWINWLIVTGFATLNFLWFYQLVKIALKKSPVPSNTVPAGRKKKQQKKGEETQQKQENEQGELNEQNEQ